MNIIFNIINYTLDTMCIIIILMMYVVKRNKMKKL